MHSATVLKNHHCTKKFGSLRYFDHVLGEGRSRDLFPGRSRRGVRALVVSLGRDKIDSQKLPRAIGPKARAAPVPWPLS